MTRADLIAEARTWLGTPFHWQASLKGVGCDCKGFIWGVVRELGLPEAESPFAKMADYGGKVPQDTLRKGLAATFGRSEAPDFGDVLLMRLAGQPVHLGFHAGGEVLHTYNAGPKQVIATPLPVVLRAWPVVSAWRFTSLED